MLVIGQGMICFGISIVCLLSAWLVTKIPDASLDDGDPFVLGGIAGFVVSAGFVLNYFFPGF